MRPILALVVIASLAPGVTAASVEADLVFPDGVSIDGSLRGVASAGIVELTPALRAGESVEISWATASGHHVVRTWDYLGPEQAEYYQENTRPANDTVAWGAARLTDLRCVQECRAVLVPDGRAGSAIALDARVRGSPTWTEVPWSMGVAAKEPGVADSFYYEIPRGALAFGPLGGASFDALALGSGSDVTLVLMGVTATVRHAEGDDALDLRTRNESRSALGIQVGRHREMPFLVLRLEDAALTLPSPTGAGALLHSPTIDLDGRLRASTAHGSLRAEDASRRLDGDALTLDGSIRGPWTDALDEAPLATQPDDGTGARARLSGEARHLTIGGTALVQDVVPAQQVALGASIAAAFLAAILLLVKWLGVVPFFTRLDRTTLLDHPTRAAIYKAVRDVPGSSPTDLVRRLDLSEVVVRHHLRKLEDHSFVRLQASGRVRAYFAVESTPTPDLRDAAIAVMDQSRQHILTQLLAAGRLTQKELAARTGLSQRLVSYHLGRLQEVGMVRGQGALPRTYAVDAERTQRLSSVLAARDG